MSSAELQSDDLPGALLGPPRYARFSRRLKGIFIDWTITLAVIFGSLIVASSLRNDDLSGALGIVAVAALVLYEPVLVSRTGGTIGHHLTNLRVVDDRHGGNVSFLKAAVRVVIKSLIGWYSFILIAATRRNQAIHDLVTRSTVQIRDPAKASPNQFVTERVELARAEMPSAWLRIAVICSYLVLAVVAFTGVAFALASAGGISARCFETDICSRGDQAIMNVLGIALLTTCVVCIVFGWKGKLLGARKA